MPSKKKKKKETKPTNHVPAVSILRQQLQSLGDEIVKHLPVRAAVVHKRMEQRTLKGQMALGVVDSSEEFRYVAEFPAPGHAGRRLRMTLTWC